MLVGSAGQGSQSTNLLCLLHLRRNELKDRCFACTSETKAQAERCAEANNSIEDKSKRDVECGGSDFLIRRTSRCLALMNYHEYS